MRQLFLFMLLTIGFVTSALARDVAGVQVPDQATLADGSQLLLNGAGVRSKFFFDIYVGALYLSKPIRQVDAVLADDGPNRVLMHFLYRKVSASQLVDAWDEGFDDNLTSTQQRALKSRIAAFDALFGDVLKGDRVRLDYLPGKGTQVWFDGQLKGTIPGADFNRALLRIWLGSEPADSSLKRAMLGTP